MITLEVYDKPMCCSTGVCGPQVDPVLPHFAADLDWLRSQGHQVQRFNLAQDPAAFASNEQVKALLVSDGVECLPLVIVDGSVVSKQIYPTREQLVRWTGESATSSEKSVPISGELPISAAQGS